MSNLIGIDLGTSNSCVAVIDSDGAPRVLGNRAGKTTTPSVLRFDQEGGVHLGTDALSDPQPGEVMVVALKRLMGRQFDDPAVRKLAGSLPYPIVAAPNGDACVEVFGRRFSPQELSSMILLDLRSIAEDYLGSPVAEAIITVPAYFDHQQRQATKDAAEIAGLRVRRLINEPTAAALGVGAHREADRRLAICDLGGGTFDVSIVNVESGVFEVLSTHGDSSLGGDDFDRAIGNELLAEIASLHQIDLVRDPDAYQRLLAGARECKHELSESATSHLLLPYLSPGASGVVFDYERLLSRSQVEEWTAALQESLELPCIDALARCGLKPDAIDAVILVGGMARMPAVQRSIAKVFGKAPLNVANPDEIVAVGAATQCAILEGVISDVVLLDVTSRTLGIQVEGGIYQQVIPRNSTIPTREHKIVTTVRDGQRQLVFDCYEGESVSASNNRLLGRFVGDELPEAPAGQVIVLVELTVDADGLLHVSARELTSGTRPRLRLVAAAGLSRGEVTRIREELSAARTILTTPS